MYFNILNRLGMDHECDKHTDRQNLGSNSALRHGHALKRKLD